MSPPPRTLLILSVSLQLLSLSLATSCYTRDGTVLNSAAYLPCDDTSAYSSCCLLDQGNGGPSDFCTTAGLCFRQDTIPGFFYIDGCTDKSWESADCPSFCSNSSQSVVQSCSDVGSGGTWCCRATGEPSCCDNAFTTDVGVLIIPSQTTMTVTQTGTASSAITSSAGTTSSVPTGSTSSLPTTCPATTKDNSAVVGGSVGGVLGAALLAALGALFWREKTRPKFGMTQSNTMSDHQEGYQGIDQMAIKDAGPYEVGSNVIQELGNNESEIRRQHY